MMYICGMKFNKVKVNTDDMYYDLFEGGYIEPEKMLTNSDDIKKVRDAIEVVKQFLKEGEEKGKIIII